ncbi:unnamed protein product [Rotaria sordida]|uniref:Uncharacterized protein n=1 Tax=Rotaria sordida TaxID=392033 RepID=A0A819ZLZ3_9BILA|nr:unnamed protein product [Rotaria sordida]
MTSPNIKSPSTRPITPPNRKSLSTKPIPPPNIHARQKWGLLVLNSEGYENLLMSSLINFQKFYTFFVMEN